MGDRLRPVARQNVAGQKEQHRFDQRVIDGVQKSAEGAGLTQTESNGQEPHVLHARVGEQPFKVGLADKEDRGHGDGHQTEREKRVLAELTLPARVAHLLNSDDPEKRAVQQGAGQQRRNKRRGFAVRIREPRMERRESHLRPVTDEHECEGRFQPGRIQGPGSWQQLVNDERGTPAAG